MTPSPATRTKPAPSADESATFALRGAGAEPVDLARTLLSHGVADLLPNVIAADGSRLETVLTAAGRAWLVELVAAPASSPTLDPGTPGETAPPSNLEPGPLGATARERRPPAAVLRAPTGAPTPPPAARSQLLAQVRHMLRLDEDLSAFYRTAAEDPRLAWAAAGAGRMLRSPTVFEDLVKTICTTNCTWSATVRMVSAIVHELGEPAHHTPERHAFPAPEALAQAPEEFFSAVARAGYRGPYLRALAADVAEGRLQLEALADDQLPDREVSDRLLEIAGVGPYAMAHMMMLLGRYRYLILDSWTRPKYRRLSGRPRVTDKGIVRAFARYRQFAGLAFWLTLTEDWVTEEQSAPSGAAIAPGGASVDPGVVT